LQNFPLQNFTGKHVELRHWLSLFDANRGSSAAKLISWASVAAPEKIKAFETKAKVVFKTVYYLLNLLIDNFV